jgi:protein involved in polysaccharide export with SLBB domain
MRQPIAILICLSLLTTSCASAGGPRVQAAPQPSTAGSAAIAEYVQRLAPGSRVRVDLADGTSLRGTLMKTSADAVVVQKHTRLPEPPIEMPMTQIMRVSVEGGSGTSTAKAVAIGITVGVASFFTILAIVAAALD